MWAFARGTWAGLCRSLVALLLSRSAVLNEGHPVALLGMPEPSGVLWAVTRDRY